ncbi:MAG: AbrB family transcriptional regulator, partial [Acetobacteraceae bacterium]
RLDRALILRSPRLALAAVLSTAIVSLLCAAIALALSAAAALPLAAVLLGTAPGGMPEMAITAKVLDLGVPLVLAFHLVRVALCSLLVGPIDRIRERLEARRDRGRGRPD